MLADRTRCNFPRCLIAACKIPLFTCLNLSLRGVLLPSFLNKAEPRAQIPDAEKLALPFGACVKCTILAAGHISARPGT